MVQRFTNILIVCENVDHLETVLQRGLWLAKANGARVTLMDVLEARPGELARHYRALTEKRATEIERQVLGHYKARLADFAVPFREAGLEVAEVVVQGTLFLDVIRRVLTDAHDLVLKGASRHRGSAVFTSNDMHLMRKAPCPVWILQSEQPAKTERVLAAVDPDTEDDGAAELTRTVLELATSLAERDGAKLDIVHAWQLQEEDALRAGRFAMSDGEIATILSSEERRHKAALDACLAPFDGIGSRAVIRLLKGAPGDVIPDYARDKSIDTIVMGTVGRTGIRGFFIGNTAETILANVKCSVLTAKPPGFVSPVGAA